MEVLGVYVPKWILLGTVPIVVAYAVKRFLTRNFGYFKALGIKGPEPKIFVGTIGPLMQMGVPAYDVMLTKEYGNVVGVYESNRPTMLISDPVMLKQILVKDFANFPNRRNLNLDESPGNLMLVSLRDGHWKHVRNLITPTFSASKLRRVTQWINQCAIRLCDHLGEKAKTGDVIDFKEYVGYFTMDVVAGTAFGLDVNSKEEENSVFVKMIKELDVKNTTDIRYIMIFFFPFLGKLFSRLNLVRLWPKHVVDFFRGVVGKAITERQQSLEKHRDFIQLMIDAEVGDSDDEVGTLVTEKLEEDNLHSWHRKGLTHDEILANSMIFFLAGFEPTSNTLAFFGYCLACNPDKQDKLLQEIDELTQNQEEISYDIVKKMTYLQMCMDETMRLYPAALRVEREAKHDTTLNGVHIRKGMIVTVPIYAIHHDPELWEDPETYIPERFSPEIKAARDPYIFYPFGVGPRNCIGMRLALLEVKIAMIQVLRRYKFVKCEETEIPIKLMKVNLGAENGVKIKVEARS